MYNIAHGINKIEIKLRHFQERRLNPLRHNIIDKY